MHSAIYKGRVKHSRSVPVPHSFRYRLFMMYLDLAELDDVFRGRWFWSSRRRALARFRREDHFGDPAVPLDTCVRERVAEETGRRPEGPIRLLTHLSYFGYCFNPVSFYYCYDSSGQAIETIIAEVNNTPWGERHLYVLSESANQGNALRKEFTPEKVMHVSPFMEMDVDYRWCFNPPAQNLSIYMENSREGQKTFDVTLSLARTEITGPSLARVLAGYPVMTLKVITAIHWQALLLWLKRVPVHAHPAKKKRMLEGRS
ncbi:MAG: DUF1365 domain-containing protein [Gammaproteobacteria bacterium]|nr:DUF1365 domain-containing protein [Gammaproteobacteria bacterium]